MEPMDVIKEEFGRVIIRLENVEVHFDNFDTTLNNHMTDYDKKLNALRDIFKWGFWVLFGMFIAAFGGLIGLAIVLVGQYLKEG